MLIPACPVVGIKLSIAVKTLRYHKWTAKVLIHVGSKVYNGLQQY